MKSSVKSTIFGDKPSSDRRDEGGDNIILYISNAGEGGDLLLRSDVGPRYYFHITKEASDAHLTLHRGDGISSSLAASLSFHSFDLGHVTIDNKSMNWEQPRNATVATTFVDFAIDQRHLRWCKTYASSKRKGLHLGTDKFIEWQLRDIDSGEQDAKIDPKEAGAHVASLSLDGAAKSVSARGGKDGNGEVGSLRWLVTQQQDVVEVATLLGLALYHRDRQVQNREKLHPSVDFKVPQRQAARSVDGRGGGTTLFGGSVLYDSAVQYPPKESVDK